MKLPDWKIWLKFLGLAAGLWALYSILSRHHLL